MLFLKMITTENGYKLNSNHIYKRFKTPMDIFKNVLINLIFGRIEILKQT